MKIVRSKRDTISSEAAIHGFGVILSPSSSQSSGKGYSASSLISVVISLHRCLYSGRMSMSFGHTLLNYYQFLLYCGNIFYKHGSGSSKSYGP